MGQSKLTLPLGHHTVIDHLVKTLLHSGVDMVLVVTGPHVPEVADLAAQAGATVFALCQATPDMRSTVEAGLDYLEGRFQPNPQDPWLLVPADHPGFSSTTISRLFQAAESDSPHGIAIPVYQGQRGHPTLFHWNHVDGIKQLPANHGINAFIQLQSQDVFEVPVDDAGVLMNLNTPDDFATYFYSHS